MSRKDGKEGVFLSVKHLVESIPGRIALVMLTTWVTVAFIPLILRINLTILPTALKWALVAGVGLTAGLAARGWLSQRTLALRLITAFLSLSSGLWLSGFLTQGYVGFRLFPRSNIAVDWIGLAQLAFGCLAAGLALFAWRVSPAIKMAARKPSGKQSRTPAPSKSKRALRKTIKPSKSARPQKSARLARRLPTAWKRAPVANKRQPLAAARRSLRAAQRTIRANQDDFVATQGNFWATQGSFWATQRSLWASRRNFWVAQRNFWASQRRFWGNAGAALTTHIQSLWTTGRTVQIRLRETGRALQNRLHTGGLTARTHLRSRFPSRSRKSMVQFQNRPHSIPSARSEDSPVHLVGETEHRCPYCLETVVRNDPRGVRVCPICHTHHHADCWAVTGTCQVPHQYE